MLLWFCVLYFEKTSEWKSLRLFFVHVSQSFLWSQLLGLCMTIFRFLDEKRLRLALKRKRVLIWVSQPMYSILEQVFLFGTAWLWEYFLSSSRSQNPHHSQLIPKHLFGNYDKFTMIMMTSLEKFAMTTKTYLKKFSMIGKNLLKKFRMTFL